MATWVLIILVYAGPMADSDSVALSSVEGFQSAKACSAAGEVSRSLVNASLKILRYVCVQK